MKRFFYILFISTTVFFSLGFRGCEWLFCSITGLLNVGVTDLGGFRGYIGEDGVYYNEYIDCVFSTNDLSVYALNDIDKYDGSNDEAGKTGNSVMVIVGDTGTVFFSLDGGETWEDRSIPGVDNNSTLTTNLYSFDFLDYGGEMYRWLCVVREV
jgi:hypothetical protein